MTDTFVTITVATPGSLNEHRYASGAEFAPNAPSLIFANLYPPNQDRSWLVGQDVIWVDFWGHVHLIDRMDREYKLNVLCYIHRTWAHRRDDWYGPLVERLHTELAQEFLPLDEMLDKDYVSDFEVVALHDGETAHDVADRVADAPHPEETAPEKTSELEEDLMREAEKSRRGQGYE